MRNENTRAAQQEAAPEARPRGEAAQVISRLHAQHERRATRVERLFDRLTSSVARPSFIGRLTLFVCLWAAANSILASEHRPPFDALPYNLLQGILTVAAVGLTSLILTTQRRADELANHREQLMLELAILSEQKSAKIIDLLEELRRDSPNLPSRTDQLAQEMSTPVDPDVVLRAILLTPTEALSEHDRGVQQQQP